MLQVEIKVCSIGKKMTLNFKSMINRRLTVLIIFLYIVAFTVPMWVKGKLSPSEGPARPQITHEDCQVQTGYYRLAC